MAKKKVLFITSEIFPYFPEGYISNICRYLPQGIQERENEIRTFMPKFGCVNEHRHMLHEVIRLSGQNIIIEDTDHPLIIKVASLQNVRMQIYFIDSEDYFKRKTPYYDAEGVFYPDNDSRAIFYAKGVIETVRKLGWEPDIIHCHGWISHIVPAMLKKVYKDDPIFYGSKVVLSLYDDTPKESFCADFASKAGYGGLSPADLPFLEKPDGINLAKTAAQYSDGIILGARNIEKDILDYCKSLGLPMLEFKKESIENGSYPDEYKAFYESI